MFCILWVAMASVDFDKITATELLKLLPSSLSTQVAWDVKQTLPELPLEVWISILEQIKDFSTARTLLKAYPALLLHIEKSSPIRTRLLRGLFRALPKLSYYSNCHAIQADCRAWSISSCTLLSCYLRHCCGANKLTLHFPEKRSQHMQFKCVLGYGLQSVTIITRWNEQEIRFVYKSSTSSPSVSTQTHIGPSFGKKLRFREMKCVPYQGPPIPSWLQKQVQTLSHTTFLLKPVLDAFAKEYKWHSCHAQKYLTQVGTIIRNNLDFGIIVDFPTLKDLWYL